MSGNDYWELVSWGASNIRQKKAMCLYSIARAEGMVMGGGTILKVRNPPSKNGERVHITKASPVRSRPNKREKSVYAKARKFKIGCNSKKRCRRPGTIGDLAAENIRLRSPEEKLHRHKAWATTRRENSYLLEEQGW